MNPTQYAIQQELELLRKRYKEEPEKRFILEIQAKVLKLALEANTPREIKPTPVEKNELLEAAQKAFLD